MFDRNSDVLPRRDTHWIRDWWRPLRTATGGGPQVMVRFFRLLAEHFPRGADTHYVRDLTWGEYVHFTSGAAGGTSPTWPGGPSAGHAGGPGSWRGLKPSSRDHLLIY